MRKYNNYYSDNEDKVVKKEIKAYGISELFMVCHLGDVQGEAVKRFWAGNLPV